MKMGQWTETILVRNGQSTVVEIFIAGNVPSIGISRQKKLVYGDSCVEIKSFDTGLHMSGTHVSNTSAH